LVEPKLFTEDGNGVSCRNAGKPVYDAAVCLRKFHWIPSPRKLQDLNF